MSESRSDYASSRPSSGKCHVGDKVLAKTTIDEENVLWKQNELVLINNHTYNLWWNIKYSLSAYCLTF